MGTWLELPDSGGQTQIVVVSCLGNVFPVTMTCLISWRNWFSQKSVSDIIQHGKYILEEIKPDVLSLEWDHDVKRFEQFLTNQQKTLSESDSVDLATSQISDGNFILPKGFVIFVEVLKRLQITLGNLIKDFFKVIQLSKSTQYSLFKLYFAVLGLRCIMSP